MAVIVNNSIVYLQAATTDFKVLITRKKILYVQIPVRLIVIISQYWLHCTPETSISYVNYLSIKKRGESVQ